MSKAKRADHNVVRDSNLNTFRVLIQFFVVAGLKIFLMVKGYKLRVHGRQNQPKGHQSYIVCSNHTSSLDPPVVSVSLFYQPIAYMAKLELFEGKFGFIYPWIGAFSVNREKLEVSTIKSAVKVLKSNRWALGMFPEGTRTEKGDVSEVKRGVAFMSKAGKSPVLPIGIYRGGADRKYIEVCIGEMLPPLDDTEAMSLSVQKALQGLIAQGKQHYEANH